MLLKDFYLNQMSKKSTINIYFCLFAWCELNLFTTDLIWVKAHLSLGIFKYLGSLKKKSYSTGVPQGFGFTPFLFLIYCLSSCNSQSFCFPKFMEFFFTFSIKLNIKKLNTICNYKLGHKKN